MYHESDCTNVAAVYGDDRPYPAEALILPFTPELTHYRADALLVRCIDNRFWKMLRAFTRYLELGHIDLVSVVGGGQFISSPERSEDRHVLLRKIDKSIRLHHTQRVILTTHHDCGAYGGFAYFGNDLKAEYDYHCREHEEMRAVVRAHFPGLAVDTYFFGNEGVVLTMPSIPYRLVY